MTAVFMNLVVYKLQSCSELVISYVLLAAELWPAFAYFISVASGNVIMDAALAIGAVGYKDANFPCFALLRLNFFFSTAAF